MQALRAGDLIVVLAALAALAVLAVLAGWPRPAEPRAAAAVLTLQQSVLC